MARDYNIYGRKKLPRNKWGLLDESSESSSSSVFGGGLGSGYNSSVGGSMVSVSEFVGATPTEDGVSGLVPAPLAGQDQYFLQGNKNWTYIPAFKWLKEWPEGEGLEKRGLGIDGDFNVSNNLSTMNLTVQGSAHFFELLIDEVRASGGQVLVSPSLFHVDWVGSIVDYDTITITNENLKTLFQERIDIYNAIKANNITTIRARRLYQRNDDGSKRITNEVWPGDMMRCKTFNIEEKGKYNNVSNTDYWSFVLDTGIGNFIDSDGITRDAFFIDLVYSMKDKSGKVYPIDTVFYMSGQTAVIPDSYTEVSDTLELKKVSQQVLTGEYEGQEEHLDGQELIDVQNAVIQIRGLSDQVQGVTGRYSTNSIDRNNLIQANKILAFATDGTLPDDDHNMSNIILEGKLLDDNPETPSELGLRSLNANATNINGPSFEPANSRLVIDIQDKVDIPISGGTVLERDFVAAEDIKDADDRVIFDKGDTVPVGTILPKDSWLIDLDKIDTVLEEVETPSGDTETIIPPNVVEINTQTDDTDTGMSRDTEINTNYASLTEWKFGYGVFSCHINDNLACLGHLWNSNRQNAIVLSSITCIDSELVPPCIGQYNNIDRFGETISKFRITSIASNGNEFKGSFLVNYDNKFVDVNDRINMFINDITTGLETVGIHLSGEDSTITLVGSVNLRQHSDSSYDTLNVFDNLNTKRVEITPLKIPTRTDTASSITDGTKHTFNSVNTTKNATSNYVSFDEGWYDWHYYKNYRLKNYSISFNISTSLGKIEAKSKVDLRNLALTLTAFTYFNGNQYISDHSDGGTQEISVLQCNIKRDGMLVKTIDLKQNAGLSITGLSTDLINIAINNAIIDDTQWEIPATGTYSVELQVTLVVYARAYTKGRFTAKIKNPYFKINTGVSGSIYSYVKRAPVNENNKDDMSASKMTIGNNGLVFSGNNSRYFYAATDGYELKWDEYGITIDSTNGVRKNGGLFTKFTTTNTGLPVWADVVVAPSSASNYYCVLPSAERYGIGRQMTITGPNGFTIYPGGTDYILKPTSTGNGGNLTSIKFGTTSLNTPNCLILVSMGKGGWVLAN